MSLAKIIRSTDKNIMLVLITYFDQYVLNGYDVNALHCLIKPLSASKLLPVLNNAYMIYRSRQKAMVVVFDDNGQMKLPCCDIFCISMLSHTAIIQTASSEYRLRKTSKELSDMLPKYFIRCHRSYIINLLKVEHIGKSSLALSNGKKLPISRNNAKTVSDAYNKLLFCEPFLLLTHQKKGLPKKAVLSFLVMFVYTILLI